MLNSVTELVCNVGRLTLHKYRCAKRVEDDVKQELLTVLLLYVNSELRVLLQICMTSVLFLTLQILHQTFTLH